MAFETLLCREAQPGVRHLTLNRPETRNAMSLQMVQELRAALAAAEREGIRVLVLRGAGGHFCAGADLRDMAAARMRLAENPRALEETNAAFGELCAAFAATGIATVAALEGTVMGGGLGLACVADVVLADDSVSLRLPETTLGVVPAQIAPYLVERLGYAEAKRLAVSAARVGAAEALALRLVHAVYPAGSLDAGVAAALHTLLQAAPGAVAATKALMAKARFEPAAGLVGEAAAVFARAALGPEGSEGTAAFLARRRPAWAPPESAATP